MIETPEGLRRQAFGGEVVDLTTAERVSFAHLQQLRELSCTQAEIERLTQNGVRIIVDEASTAMPMLLEWGQGQNVKVDSIEEYVPPFDDVFVELVKEQEVYE